MMQPGTLIPMSEWSENLVSNIAATIRKRRQELGLSVQDVADRTADLGHPLNRSTLSDLENDRRKDRLFIGDLLALAESLRVHPVELLYPNDADTSEVLPNTEVSTAHAREWLAGNHVPPMPEDWDSTNGRIVEYQYRGNETHRRNLLAVRDLYHAHDQQADELANAGDHDNSAQHRQAADELREYLRQGKAISLGQDKVVDDG